MMPQPFLERSAVLERVALCALVALSAGCATRRLAGKDLDRVVRPAYISRIEEGAGPKSLVFREDGSYGEKLKKLETREADRRLHVKLTQAVTRFEVSERLRTTTLNLLPREKPWTSTVNPAQVATALESFLVEEVPANPPDYDLLKPLGADAVVEFVVEEYGIKSADGKAGAYIEGYGRMFELESRDELWRRPFHYDQVNDGTANLDPFRVGKEPELFRLALTTLLDKISADFAKDLSPPDRRGGPALSSGPEQTAPDSTNTTGAPARAPLPASGSDELAPGELPSPDP